ncbi:RNA polymerase sigma factor [bacterium]|nr:RNA polymerase sigma factor [bacterium]
MNEISAITLCLKYRDPIGFEYLVKKYRREAMYHALSILGEKEDALDACQESFTKAYNAMPRLKTLDAFYPWFYRILRNTCLNMIRKKKNTIKFQRGYKEEYSGQAKAAAPDSILENKEKKIMIQDVFSSIQPQYREILSMKYVSGYSYEEISETLGIPRGTVMSRLYHARKVFQKKYKEISKSGDRSSKEVLI